MEEQWSQKIEAKYSIHLNDELREWYNQGLYRYRADFCFGIPIHPETLVYKDDRVIWGGLMLPDTLPVLENGGGDAICMQIDRNGHIREYVQWNHETNEYQPCGQTLSHVILSETFKSCYLDISKSFEVFLSDPLTKWAMRKLRLTEENIQAIVDATSQRKILPGLIEQVLPWISSHELITELSIRTGLEQLARNVGGGQIAKKIGVKWEQFHLWFLRPEMMPEKYLKKIARKYHYCEKDLTYQNWSYAVRVSSEVIDQRQDLGWPYVILGKCAEREGRIGNAIELYFQAAQCLKLNHGFTRWWPKTDNRHCYPVDRLLMYSKQLPDFIKNDNYFAAMTDADNEAVFNYWKSMAYNEEQSGEYLNAYKCWYAAGWDEHTYEHMDEILCGIIRSAKEMNSDAYLKIAKIHQKYLVRI